MFQKCATLARFCCAFFALALAAYAADPASTDSDGSHEVKFKGQNGGVATIRVQEAPSPYANVNKSVAGSSDKYDPESLDFSKSANLGDKTFDMGDVSSTANNQASEAREGRTFETKSFLPSSSGTTPGLDRSFDTGKPFNLDAHPNESTKTFATTTADVGQNQTFAGTKTSPFQDKTVLLADHKPATFANAEFADKTFDDPEMKNVRRDPYANGMDVSRMVHVPNRTLTIDEVRELINHEVIPNTDQAPDANQSKAMNDPGYVPPASPAPPPLPAALRDAKEDGDSLPSPGMMAAPEPPENSEPLPSK